MFNLAGFKNKIMLTKDYFRHKVKSPNNYKALFPGNKMANL